MPGRTGAIGVLVAEFHFVARRLGDFHFCPIRLHFISDDERHPSSDALPHLGTMTNDGDGSVGRNRYESQWIVYRAVRDAVGARWGSIIGQRRPRRQDMYGEHEAAR